MGARWGCEYWLYPENILPVAELTHHPLESLIRSCIAANELPRSADTRQRIQAHEAIIDAYSLKIKIVG